MLRPSPKISSSKLDMSAPHNPLKLSLRFLSYFERKTFYGPVIEITWLLTRKLIATLTRYDTSLLLSLFLMSVTIDDLVQQFEGERDKAQKVIANKNKIHRKLEEVTVKKKKIKIEVLNS
ncbi:hypothetical protein ACLOJK_022440 [Asimina triloba]